MQVQTMVDDRIGVGHGTINGGIISNESAEELKIPVTEHLIAVADNAPSACIDGRSFAKCMDGSETEPRPSVAGGGLITAYAAAELTGWFGYDDSNSAQRLNNLSAHLSAMHIKFGGHCDEAAIQSQFQTVDPSGTLQPKTGCGANDRLPEILNQPYQNAAEVEVLTEVVMNHEFSDDKYDPGYMSFVNQARVNKENSDWNPVNLIDKLGADTANNIEVLKGSHEEFAVIFNYVEGTTIDRDEFTQATGEQAFVVDVWYLDKLSKAMARGTNMVEQQKQLKHAMVAYQVSTYLTLCDGSQRAYFVG